MLKTSDQISLQLRKLDGKTDEICKRAVYVGAGVMADQIRANLKKNLAASKETTGDLLDSLGITPPKLDREGNWNAKVGFDGYDKKGVPNQLKARAMESGTSKQKKKPFVRPAISQAREKAKKAMEESVGNDIKLYT